MTLHSQPQQVNVRRAPSTSVGLTDAPMLLEEKTLPLMHENDDLLTVRHQLRLGTAPKLLLEWDIHPQAIHAGCRINIFRTTTGLTPTFGSTPLELINHGALVFESSKNDSLVWQVREGTEHITLLATSPTPRHMLQRIKTNIRRKFTGSTVHVFGFIRFSVTIPGVSDVIQRIEQNAQLHEAQIRDQRAQEKLDRRLNQSDMAFQVNRHAKLTAIETAKRIAEFQAIRACFAEQRRALLADSSLNQRDRNLAIDQLDGFERAQLSAANFPFIDRNSLD